MANEEITRAMIRHIRNRLDDPHDLGRKNPSGNYIFPRVRAARERDMLKLHKELHEE